MRILRFSLVLLVLQRGVWGIGGTRGRWSQ
jgi:hypothetical protein